MTSRYPSSPAALGLRSLAVCTPRRSRGEGTCPKPGKGQIEGSKHDGRHTAIRTSCFRQLYAFYHPFHNAIWDAVSTGRSGQQRRTGRLPQSFPPAAGASTAPSTAGRTWGRPTPRAGGCRARSTPTTPCSSTSWPPIRRCNLVFGVEVSCCLCCLCRSCACVYMHESRTAAVVLIRLTHSRFEEDARERAS